MTLCPLEQARLHLLEAARCFEQAGRKDEAFQADCLARKAQLIDEEQDTWVAQELARSEAESAEWEATHFPTCRDFISAAQASAGRA